MLIGTLIIGGDLEIVSGVMSGRGHRRAGQCSSGSGDEAPSRQLVDSTTPLVQNVPSQYPTTSYASVNATPVILTHWVKKRNNDSSWGCDWSIDRHTV